jgi:hypothetical protein
MNVEKETLRIFKTLAKEYAKSLFGGCEPSYSSHGEDFAQSLEEYEEEYNEKLTSLLESYREEWDNYKPYEGEYSKWAKEAYKALED